MAEHFVESAPYLCCTIRQILITEQEAADYERRLLNELNSDRRDGNAGADLRRNYNEFWRDRGTTVVASRRTSIVVDPSDERIPPFTPEARRNEG